MVILLWPKLCYFGGVVSLDTGDKDSQQKDIREVAKLITEHGVTEEQGTYSQTF